MGARRVDPDHPPLAKRWRRICGMDLDFPGARGNIGKGSDGIGSTERRLY
jgi:hypothetical protein